VSRLARIAWPCGALVGAALALYWRSLGYPQVFDDLRLTAPALQRALDDGFRFELRTLNAASFGWIHALAGPDWRWQRLANVLLHGAVVSVLFLFLRRLFSIVISASESGGAPWLAFFGAMLFLAHPVAVYGVAYGIQRSIILATLLSLASLWLFLEGLKRGGAGWFVGAAAAYLAAVFSKEHCVMLPAVAAALAVLVRGWPPRPWRDLVLPFVLYTAIALLITAKAKGYLGAAYEPFAQTLVRQVLDPRLAADLRFAADPYNAAGTQGAYALSVLNQGYLFFRYLLVWLLPWPGWMSIDLRPAFPASLLSWPQSAGFLAWLAWPVLGTALLLRSGRTGLAGLAMLAAWLLALTEFATVRVQEPFVLYRSYLWMSLLPAALPVVLARLPFRGSLVILLLAALALVYPFADRLQTFSSDLALWDDAVRKIADPRVPYADRPYRNRGVAHAILGRDAEALRDIDRAIALHPGNARSWFMRGTLHMRAARNERARADFDRALAIDPLNGEALARRCLVLMRLKMLDAALADCERAVSLVPTDVGSHVVLGMARALRGETALAERHYRRALQLDPADAMAQYQYGVLLKVTGRVEEARRRLSAACRTDIEAACKALE
jgi:tetratricopeptide (TPR) repeat protein